MSCAVSAVQLLRTACTEAASELHEAPSSLLEERRVGNDAVGGEEVGREMAAVVCEWRDLMADSTCVCACVCVV